MKKLFREIRKDESKEEYLEEMANKCWIRSDCRVIYGNTNLFFSNIIWNTYNQNDPILSGSDFYILHIDGNLLNEKISNLKKINIYEYKKEYLEEMKKMCRIRKGRRIYGHGKKPFAQLVWNIFNRENPVVKGDGFHIHHKDLNKLNDDINNLQKLTSSDHTSLHNIGNKYGAYSMSDEVKRKISLSHMGIKPSEETRKKLSLIKKGKPLSMEHRKKISDSQKGRKHTEESIRKMSLKSKKGSDHYKSRLIMAEYMIFETISKASVVLNIKISTILYRIQKHKSGYFYINKERINSNDYK